MTAIVDYGVGNLFSLKSSFAYIGEKTLITGDESELSKADRIILPGVGAFADAIGKLKASGLDKAVKRIADSGKPLLGICLGMQLLFDKSHEYGEHDGLSLIKGSIAPIDDMNKKLRIPHTGWNSLTLTQSSSPLLKYLKDGDYVYFVHSYCAGGCQNNIIATSDYGKKIVAAVANGNIYGTQFHPEKSGDVGLSVLRAFCEI